MWIDGPCDLKGPVGRWKPPLPVVRMPYGRKMAAVGGVPERRAGDYVRGSGPAISRTGIRVFRIGPTACESAHCGWGRGAAQSAASGVSVRRWRGRREHRRMCRRLSLWFRAYALFRTGYSKDPPDGPQRRDCGWAGGLERCAGAAAAFGISVRRWRERREARAARCAGDCGGGSLLARWRELKDHGLWRPRGAVEAPG